MDILTDIMVGVGAIGAAIYCLILSKRLRRFNNLQNGMGGAVAVLSAQVDDMTKMLTNAQDAAGQSAIILTDLTERAESAARKLELMMASLHDLPENGKPEIVVPDIDLAPKTSLNEPEGDNSAPLFFSHRVTGTPTQ